ncbi:MAG: DUF6799 domain-containing protein [Ferruginibacter sp.]
MKKLISLSAVFLISAIVFAQDSIPPVKKNLPDSMKMDTIPGVNKMNKDTSLLSHSNTQSDTLAPVKKISDRVIMKDEQTIVVKNGDSTLLKDSIQLESGAIVLKDGTVTYTSGKTVKLKNGQFIALSNTAESDSGADSTSEAKPDDKIVMKDDKVIVVKKGDSTVLADSIKLGSGAVVRNDATVQFKDGTTAKLKNGQSIALTTAPDESKSKTDTATATKTATTTSTSPATVAEDKVIMKDDKVMVVMNGDSTLLADSIKLKSGAVVQNDGSVRFKDGTTTKLKNGQFIALNPPPAEAKKTKTAATRKKKAKG